MAVILNLHAFYIWLMMNNQVLLMLSDWRTDTWNLMLMAIECMRCIWNDEIL